MFASLPRTPQPRPALYLLGALLGLGVAACGGLEPEAPTGQLAAGLANGTPDVAHPAVGLVLRGVADCTSGAGSGVSVCTGTLIGRHTVLTAGHCVADPKPAYAFCPPGGGTRQVARVLAHPGFLATQPLGLDRTTDDIGLLILKDDVVDLAAAVVAARTPVAGEAATVVGWGVLSDRGDEPQGQARSGTKAVSAVSAKTLETQPVGGSPAICSGDSGGPLLQRQGDRDVLLGVVSTSVSPEGALCSTGTEYYTRADVYREWIAGTPGADLRPLVDTASTPTPSDDSSYRALFDGLSTPQPTTAPSSSLSPAAGEEVQGVSCAVGASLPMSPRSTTGALPWLLTLLALALHRRRGARTHAATPRR